MSHRKLTDHIVNQANDKLTIEVLDGPGAGGACHTYKISGFEMSPEWLVADQPAGLQIQHPNFVVLGFQNGPVAEAGVNGITHEALLAIVADRLRSFQAGLYACRENALALVKIEEAQHWLHHRTKARVARGVEGTHEK